MSQDSAPQFTRNQIRFLIIAMSAFVGLMAIGGRFGSLIVDIPFTVSVVLVASLVEMTVQHCGNCAPQWRVDAIDSGNGHDVHSRGPALVLRSSTIPIPQ